MALSKLFCFPIFACGGKKQKQERCIQRSNSKQGLAELLESKVKEISPNAALRYPSVTETGQSSTPKDNILTCRICEEPSYEDELLCVKGCTHCYCFDCLVNYLSSMIEGNGGTISCPEPNCVAVLEPEYFQQILPEELFERWSNGLCESMFLSANNFYCPYKDCSAVITSDENWGMVSNKEYKCPDCKRLFCAQCEVPWHLGINCQDFQKLNMGEREIGETGESSNSEDYTFVCEICTEPKPKTEFFRIKGCSHCYCSECMASYVASKIEENVNSISCPVPKCLGVVELEFCRPILPREVFDRWGNSLCESLIPSAQKFYCPFKECSALIANDGGMVVTQSECPHCRKMFCAQCKVAWHFGIKCEEYKKLKTNERETGDIMLMKLAKDKKWQRCPKCGFYVEKSDGCLYMKCRCKYEFCYTCASPMKGSNHVCPKCQPNYRAR